MYLQGMFSWQSHFLVVADLPQGSVCTQGEGRVYCGCMYVFVAPKEDLSAAVGDSNHNFIRIWNTKGM